jgi:hypothetical protein
VGWTLSANSKEDNSRLRGIKSGIASFQEVGAVKKTRVLIPALTALLLFSGCAAKVTTTTSSPPTTNAPTTTTAGSTSTTTTALSTVATTFTAQLSGTEVVPAVDTSATGSATFTVDATGTRVHFVLKVSNITDVIASRVHEGKPGTNGQGLLILFPGPTHSGNLTGVLAQGNFNASVLIGSLTGKTIADFVALLESGQAYVNVGTTKNPKGEIRGQIR